MASVAFLTGSSALSVGPCGGSASSVGAGLNHERDSARGHPDSKLTLAQYWPNYGTVGIMLALCEQRWANDVPPT